METDKNTGKLLHDYVDLLMLKLIHEHKLSKDIGNILFLSKGAVSKRIRRLEAHNYIVSKKVGIIREIDLTPEGNSLLEQFTNAGTPKSGNYQVNYLETHKIRSSPLVVGLLIRSHSTLSFAVVKRCINCSLVSIFIPFLLSYFPSYISKYRIDDVGSCY